MAAGGRPDRGARSQFRLGTGGLFQGIFPVHRDIMDIGPPTQPSFPNASNRVTRTRTVREYEQTIAELKKENFDLKLRVFFFEEKEGKISSKENCSPEKDNVIQIVVQLKLETESLKTELDEKEKLLQDAIQQADKFASENAELSKKIIELQGELASIAEHPSKEEYASLQKQSDNLAKQNESLVKDLSQKDDELRMSQEKIQLLCEIQNTLQEKKDKAIMIISGLMNKGYKEKESLPDEMRTIAETAVQAARNQNKVDLKMAVKSFSAALSVIMSSSSSSNILSPGEQVEKKESPGSESQCLTDKSVVSEKSISSTPKHKNSSHHSQSSKDIQQLKEQPKEPKQPKEQNLQSFTLRGTPLSENFSQKDIVDFITFSNVSEETESYSLPNVSSRSRQMSFVDTNAIDASPSTSHYVESVVSSENKQTSLDVLEENKRLKRELEEKLVLVNDLKSVCQRLRSQMLEMKKDGALEASTVPNAESVQSSHLLSQLRECGQLSTEAVIQLREDNLLMSLTIEEKEKELEDIKRTLSSVQAELDEALSIQNPLSEEALNEKNELLERLASSSQVNEELMRHLQNLEKFMESLLQHIMNNSNLDSSEQSSFLSQVSRCFNESHKLTTVLSDHLSICERSKFFEECSRVSLRNHSEDRSFPNLDVSESSFADYFAGLQQQKGMSSFGGENVFKCFPSSDSDIWSEPDRDVSLQRIGINVQLSPHSFKSPRKLRSKRRFSADRNNSSTTDVQQHTFKINRRHGVEREPSEQTNQRESKCSQVTSSSELEKCREEIKNLKEEKNSNNAKLKKADQKISEMQESLDAKQKEQKSLSLRIDRLQSEKESLSSKCKELQSDLKDTLNQLSDLQKECGIYKDDSVNKKKILDANKKEIKILKEIIEKLQCNEKSLSAKCSELQTAIESAKNKQSDIQNQCDMYEEALQKKKESLDANIEELESLNERIKLLHTEKDSLSFKCGKLQSALDDARTDFPDIKIQADDSKDTETENEFSNVNINELKSLRKEIENLQTEKEALSTKCSELESALENNKGEYSDLQNQSADYAQNITKSASEKELWSLHKKIEKLDDDNFMHSEKIVVLESALEKVKKQSEIYKEDLIGKEDSLNACKKELKYLNERLEIVVSEKNSLSAKCSELQAALENGKNEISNIQDESVDDIEVVNSKDELYANENELKSLNEMIETLEDDKESLSKKCNELQSELIKIRTKYSYLQNQIDHYKGEILSKNGSLDEYKKEQETLRDQIKTLSHSEETLSAKCEKMQAELENSEDQLRDLKNQLDIYKAEAEYKNNRLEACKEELKSLKQSIEESLSAEKSSSDKCNRLESKLMNAQRLHSELQNHCDDFKEQVLNKTKSLDQKKREIESLNQAIEKLQLSEKSLSSKCRESEIAFAKQRDIYEEESSKMREKFYNEMLELEQKFQAEKEELATEVSSLCSEREDTQKKLVVEKEKVEKLKDEMDKVNQKIAENEQQIAMLRCVKDELERNFKIIAEEKDSIQNSLLSSESRCVVLEAELAEIRENLQNLQSKCKVHKKELQILSQQKVIFKNNVLSTKNKLSAIKENVQEVCRSCNIELSVEFDETISSLNLSNMEELSEAVNADSEKVSEMVRAVLKAFKDSERKSQEIKLNHDKNIIKLGSIKKQVDLLKNEVEHLHKQNDILKHAVEKNQSLLSDREKLIKSINSEVEMLKEKLQNSFDEIEKGKSLVNIKDDEITVLQEHLLNLQTEMNNILSEKTKLMEQASESLLRDMSEKCINSTLSCNLLPSMTGNDEHDSDESSISSHPRNSCCEYYWKRCRSLKRKLVLAKNQIKVLEEQKESLRKFQISNKKSEESEAVRDKILGLQSQLEEKKIFISELREELLEAHNAVIDKEREVSSLKSQIENVSEKPNRRHSTADMDTELNNMRNYKWTLIQEILDIQKDFYVKKGIRMNYFDKFRKQVEGQYASFVEDVLPKSKSLPHLGLHDPVCYKSKCLVGLDLDIECLKNLKVFLAPFIAVSSSSVSPIHELEDSLPKAGNKKNLGILELFTRKMKMDVLQENFRMNNFILNVSKHVDALESLFGLAEQFEEFPNFTTVTDSSDVEASVVKILGEIKSLKPRADNLFSLNSALKNLDTFPNKTDVSDQESVMSEETLSISGCETPSVHEKSNFFKPTPEHLLNPKSSTRIPYEGGSSCQKKVRGSWECVNQRSQYSSPDLGIESDPNHEICCPPSQREYQESNPNENILSLKHCITLDTEKNNHCTEKEIRLHLVMDIPEQLTDPARANKLYAICNLSHYELLKREVQESLVGIKSVLSRTGDGMHHIGKHISPRKTLEYSTLRAIKDTCGNIEVCLKEAYAMVGKFWVAHCPTEQEWNAITQENQKLVKQLKQFKALAQKQETEYKSAMERLEHAQLLNANMEKKITKKLVKTKKVIRQAELKLLENRCQNSVPPVPKFPSEHP